ncbi:DUF2183 domain-containing protein [bacterium]|nr:DUF2183 domain-containing protein [bacterium]
MKKSLCFSILMIFSFYLVQAEMLVPGLYELQCKPSTIKNDESIILFPTAAKLSESGKFWIVPIHGWIFEHERDDIFRNFIIRQLMRGSGALPGTVEAEIFKERLHWFLVDNESGKKIMIKIVKQFVTLEESGNNGHFYGTIKLPLKRITELKKQNIEILVKSEDPRKFAGFVHFIPKKGITVISDIDDTIKISNVRNKKELMKNTFLKDFIPAPGMARLYSKWKKHGVYFHYVSSSPWQLYYDIQLFMKKNAFPEAVFHLKNVRLKDTSLLKLFADPVKTKQIQLEKILKDYPEHKFILVGDSGEKDPEVYGIVTRKYSDRIIGIAIRDVTGDSMESKRYKDAFREIPVSKWKIFKNPEYLDFIKNKE